jgi:hypothetical protein
MDRNVEISELGRGEFLELAGHRKHCACGRVGVGR